MKRTLIMIVSGIILVVAIGGIFMFMQMDNNVQRVLEKYGSAIAGSPVTVAKVSISPTSGVGSATDLTVHNPAGFVTDHAFMMNDTHVAMEVKTAQKDVVIVDEVVMDSPDIIFEVSEHGNNFSILRTKINDYLSNENTYAEHGAMANKQVIIKDFYLRNGKVKVIAPSLQNQSFVISIPTIHLSNVGEGQGKGNLPNIMQQIMTIVVNSVVSSVGNVNLQNFHKFLPGTPSGDTNHILNETGTAVQNMGEEIGEAFK